MSTNGFTLGTYIGTGTESTIMSYTPSYIIMKRLPIKKNGKLLKNDWIMHNVSN